VKLFEGLKSKMRHCEISKLMLSHVGLGVFCPLSDARVPEPLPLKYWCSCVTADNNLNSDIGKSSIEKVEITSTKTLQSLHP
jgi:hypothetical protein